MSNTNYNKDKLIKVSAFDKENKLFYFFKEKTYKEFLWFKTKGVKYVQGYYEYEPWDGYCLLCHEKDAEEYFAKHNMMVINREVYIKPRVVFNYHDGYQLTVYFKTFEEAKKHMEKFIDDNKRIKFMS